MFSTFPKVLVHIVTYESHQHLSGCLTAVFDQEGYNTASNLKVVVTDNSAARPILPSMKDWEARGVHFQFNEGNFGFCGAHNQGVYQFLQSDAAYFLVLNPDVRLSKSALSNLVQGFQRSDKVGACTPLLYRCDEDLNPLVPTQIDAAGMVITNSLRHFDRGSNESESEEFLKESYVFGGTGACLLLSRECVEDLLVIGAEHEKATEKIYPVLARGRDARAPLFDEAFFAYREDADLAWRMQLFGWRCLFVPRALSYHVRRVVPENRNSLPAALNQMSVRNRFLLQINNFWCAANSGAIVPGLLIRNLLVVLGVILTERASLRSFPEILILWKRARERRIIFGKRRVSAGYMKEWFHRDTLPLETEEVPFPSHSERSSV